MIRHRHWNLRKRKTGGREIHREVEHHDGTCGVLVLITVTTTLKKITEASGCPRLELRMQRGREMNCQGADVVQKEEKSCERLREAEFEYGIEKETARAGKRW